MIRWTTLFNGRGNNVLYNDNVGWEPSCNDGYELRTLDDGQIFNDYNYVDGGNCYNRAYAYEDGRDCFKSVASISRTTWRSRCGRR